MKRQILLLLLLFLFAPASQAQTAPNATGSIPARGDQPGFSWLMRPSTLPVDMFYPQAANAQSVVGRASLECAPRADQRVDCNVVSEGPSGWSFGDAALGVSRSFRVEANMRDGRVIGAPRGRVNLAFSPYSAAALPDRLDLPMWEAAPNAAAVNAAWSEGKDHAGARGRAVLSCTVLPTRALNCRVLRETSENLGLGRAALALVPQFRVAESDESFVARHSDAPFLMPFNFGMGALYEPLNRFTDGSTPIHVPDPPAAAVALVYPSAARAAHLSGSAEVSDMHLARKQSHAMRNIQ